MFAQKMPARPVHSASVALPFPSGRLSISGATVQGTTETDAFDVVVDDKGEVCVFVVRVASPLEPPPGVAAEALATTRVAIKSRLPVYELVAEIRRLGGDRGSSFGLSLLRFSPRDARVEILVAGMPPVVRLQAGADPVVHPALSGAIGESFTEVHPYELSPLIWGSAWVLASDGVTGGLRDSAVLAGRLTGSELERRAFELSSTPSFELSPLITGLSGPESAHLDRTLLIVHADPTQRRDSAVPGLR